MSEYISREAVKQLLRMEMKFSLEAMVADPEVIPSADVRENIHGHWVVGFGSTWCSCSECSGNGSRNWSYCPWCGCCMKEEK